ncbi:hypothetical protein [Sphingobacterium paludis]|uniref:Uncharacterized protein n=1 Tax=Sphingobacterium paludis TaxID=1476465 RepID=A0A4R7CRK2_9SPHI|nr:hypothetical protein [Sphingobacterium paludis]TDS06812.1 hypothetical protein B0I21_11557 [Sphingobacterium paludis]
MKKVELAKLLPIAAVAIAISSFGLMSFSTSSDKLVENWYSVGTDGQTINTTPNPNAPSSCPAVSGDHCAIRLDIPQGEEFPATVNDALQMQNDGKLEVTGESYRSN